MGYEQNKDIFSLLREVTAALGRGPRQGFSVRPGQNKVLKTLNKHDSMRQQELLAVLGIRPASLSELLGKLEKDGYITRQRSGRVTNEFVVEITEKGRISALENELSVKERDEALFGKLEPQEKNELARILNKLLAIWGDDPDETEGERRERRWKENEQLRQETLIASDLTQGLLEET